MNIVGIIPARMASTRFPGKSMAEIHGLPMVGHIYLRSKMSKLLNQVYLATPDKEIFDYIKSIKGKPVMTKTTHRSAPDRTAEAVEKIERETGQKIDIVLMIQGDEPMIRPEMLDATVKPLLEDKSLQICNLGTPIVTDKEHQDPNIVKVVVDKNDCALYFSREPIPSFKKITPEEEEKVSIFKQTGIISFKRDFLIEFNQMPPTPLELIESVDMLRLLENGLKVKMAFAECSLYSVDTPQDLEFVKQKMANEELMKTYL